jgi:oligoribonuclease (3'-5' exoribonuclease)
VSKRILLWLDLETTGLSPTAHDILEVAAYTADFDRPLELAPLYHAIARACVRDGQVTWRTLDGAHITHASPDTTVQEMHRTGGLWEACAASQTDLYQLRQGLVDSIRSIVAPDTRIILAGANPRFDFGFMSCRAPEAVQPLHHRLYDTDAVMLFCESLGMPKYQKKHAHRAQADVLDEVENLRQCREWLHGAGRVMLAESVAIG